MVAGFAHQRASFVGGFVRWRLGDRLTGLAEEYDVVGHDGRHRTVVVVVVLNRVVGETAVYVYALSLGQVVEDSVSQQWPKHAYPVPLCVLAHLSLQMSVIGVSSQ